MRRYFFACGSAWLVSAVVLALGAAPARAQSCHTPSLRAPTDGGFHVGFGYVTATFSDDAASGSYQGLIPALSWSHPVVTAELALPVYRIAQRGDEAIGLGDVVADARVAVLRTETGSLAFGPELAFTLPSGDPDRDLGMGHVMLMPGLWLRLAWEELSILAQLSYGRALGSSDAHAEHQHHAGAAGPVATPRVNPMNGEELGHALGIRYAASPNVGLTARWLGGVPLTDDGIERQLIGAGLEIQADPLDASVEVQVPVAGDPFDVRVAATFGATL